MYELIQIGILFGAKMLDNMLSTAKTILIQRNRCILAGISLALSNYIYFLITKNIVTADNDYAIFVVSVASGIGCLIAMAISNRFSKERTFVNVIMSDDKAEMQKLRDFLAEHHITNVATDSYTLDWNTESITVTAYAETKTDSRLIDEYIKENSLKCKRVVHPK